MTPRDLKTLFAPKSIAVVGATERPGSVGESIFRNLLYNGFQGVVYPINFRAKHVMGVHAYPSLTALGEAVDLAIMCVPPPAVMSALEECGKLGIKNVSVITAGFKEIGGEGVELENQLKALAKKYDINLMGPNCLGHINTDPTVKMNASFSRRTPDQGNLGFISQSGALCGAVLDYAAAKKIGFSKFISFGNKADVNEFDLLNYLSEDPATDVIIMYLEDLIQGRAFVDLAREITGERATRKPILAIKTGRTAQGAAAAASHTGSLAGSDEVYDALFKQAGVLRVDTVEDLFDFATAFASQPIPKGNRVCILTNAGGPGIMTTDACVRHDLVVPRLTPETVAALQEALPSCASTNNPVDVIGDARADRYKAALDVILKDPNIDSVIVLVTPQNMTEVVETAEEVAAAVKTQQGIENPKTIVAVFMGSVDMQLGADILNDNCVPVYQFPESAVRSLSQMVKYEDWLLRPRTEVKKFEVDKTKAQKIIDSVLADGRTQLPEIESLELLKSYGFPVPAFAHAPTPEQAVDAAETLGYPVVLKISSPDILHKTDVGGVKLNLRDAASVKAAATEILETSARLRPNARIWGVTVEPMSKPGREVILGMTRDERFGPVVMFGLGGVYTELLKDVSFRLAPIRELGAQRMIESLKTKALFDSFRGSEPADKEAIYDAIERLSQLVIDFPQIKEMDINPMLVYSEGQGAAIVDARIILEDAK
ncbi:MAG TPA: acetate--CoA ligase family protein [Capsulimonadaceae bacterium]|jgi:acetyltransferase